MGASFDEVYVVVRAIPPGRVMTYGQISQCIEATLSAAAVGWALNQCPDDVPWHRVVNAAGKCSVDRGDPNGRQRRRLEKEGVEFSPDRVDLRVYRYEPSAG